MNLHDSLTPYENREISSLKFNKRVLDQAMDLTNPLLERCKFLAIFSSNIDEFAQVRLGSLVNQNEKEPEKRDYFSNLNAKEQIAKILEIFSLYYKASSETYQFLRAELESKGLKIVKFKSLNAEQKKHCKEYFISNILPMTSPMVLDPKHPLFRFENLRTYLLTSLSKDDNSLIGIVSLHSSVKRIYQIPDEKNTVLITSEELLAGFADLIFEGYEVCSKSLIRITRNADISTSHKDADDEYDFDFLLLVQSRIAKRTSLDIVRLECSHQIPEEIRTVLLKKLKVKKMSTFIVDGPFDYSFLFKINDYFSYDALKDLKYKAFKPIVPTELNSGNILTNILKKDYLLFYPYNNMDSILNLLNQAAIDDRVKTIKITIYRLAKNSKIIQALLKAAENNKEVIVLMELTARFDESNNLYIADYLREQGITVFYGIDDYKVHSKIISITLEENDEIKYITHLGTGNYNEATASMYTDLNLLTANEVIGKDGSLFFRNLAVKNISSQYQCLKIAPLMLKQTILDELDTEIAKGKDGVFRAKFNSLTDEAIIEKLIQASQAGVKINLIIRGICCLRPGVKGISENINIISIVGRFLEHSRIYVFGKEERVYISSADLMTRNLNRRIEILTPILDSTIKTQILQILSHLEEDTLKARRLDKFGKYDKIQTLANQINSQEDFFSLIKN